MVKINKKNINSFTTEYNFLKGCHIKNLKYDILDNKLQIVFNNIKLAFKGIKECNIKEVFDWEEIDKIFLSYVKLEEMEFICFATSEKEPNIYVVCDEMKYAIIK